MLPALLLEVRGLRAAMEQMAAAGPRVQLALGRVQLQEQRINNLIRRLDEVRVTLGGAQTNYNRLRRDSRILEEALRNPPADGPPVQDLKDQQIRFTEELATAQTVLQRANADEAAIASELASEQARWTDLNQRMEALEAALGRGDRASRREQAARLHRRHTAAQSSGAKHTAGFIRRHATRPSDRCARPVAPAWRPAAFTGAGEDSFSGAGPRAVATYDYLGTARRIRSSIAFLVTSDGFGPCRS